MTVSIDKPRSLAGNTIEGLQVWAATLTVAGLSQGSTNTFSATANGTPSGTPLLGRNPTLFGAPKYIPTDTSDQGGWSEAALPSLDASGNLQFSLAVAGSTSIQGSSTVLPGGPESFRIGIDYAIY